MKSAPTPQKQARPPVVAAAKRAATSSSLFSDEDDEDDDEEELDEELDDEPMAPTTAWQRQSLKSSHQQRPQPRAHEPEPSHHKPQHYDADGADVPIAKPFQLGSSVAASSSQQSRRTPLRRNSSTRSGASGLFSDDEGEAVDDAQDDVAFRYVLKAVYNNLFIPCCTERRRLLARRGCCRLSSHTHRAKSAFAKHGCFLPIS